MDAVTAVIGIQGAALVGEHLVGVDIIGHLAVGKGARAGVMGGKPFYCKGSLVGFSLRDLLISHYIYYGAWLIGAHGIQHGLISAYDGVHIAVYLVDAEADIDLAVFFVFKKILKRSLLAAVIRWNRGGFC